MQEDDQIDFQVLPQLSPEQQKRLQNEYQQRIRRFYQKTQYYSLESWYSSLAKFTFQSVPFPISNIEGYIISLIYHNQIEKLQKPIIKKAYQDLILKVNSFLKQYFPNGCFMKLSTRSPKDAGWQYQDRISIQQHTKNLYNSLKGLKQINSKVKNQIYRYFLQQSKLKLKVCSAKDFIQIFSHSQRIQIDLNDLAFLNNRAFKNLGEEDYSQANNKLIDVWGRQWIDCQWRDEFRCFFHNYQLTGISQYDQRCYFQELIGKQLIIQRKIINFFQSILPSLKKLQMSQGVLDLIVKNDSSEPVIMIEINIFDHNSRASLFSWDNDLEILKNGPRQIRLLKQEIQISKYELIKMMGMVEKGIENILENLMKNLGLEENWRQLQ